MTGKPGCIAISRDGRALLVLGDVDGEPQVMLFEEYEGEARDRAGLPIGVDKEAFIASAELKNVVADETWVACTTVSGPNATVPNKTPPIAVSSNEGEIVVAIAGNRPVRFNALHHQLGAFRVTDICTAKDAGPFFLLAATPRGEFGNLETRAYWVDPVRLGEPLCVPRPRAQAVVASPPPPFTASPEERSCLAMTADGAAAAFVISGREMTLDGDTKPLDDGQMVRGAGTAPGSDLRRARRVHGSAGRDAAAATLTFSDGSTEKVTLPSDQRDFVTLAFAPHKTTTVKITIDALHAGTLWEKSVALSEVQVLGPGKPR